MQVAKNRKARIAVVRVSVSAAPRGVNRPPIDEPPAHAQRAAFGALQQHKADECNRDDQLGDKQQCLHL